MPTIEISKKDVEKLAGKKVTEEMFLLAKAEIDSQEKDRIKLDIADTNRPDLWSTEGVAREIKGEFREVKTSKSGLKVVVDKNLKNVRPYTICAVVKDLKITDEVLFQMIQLQEKVCETFGRKRKDVAIGVYDYDVIESPVLFKAFKPNSMKFVPLDMEEHLSLKEILEKHPKGQEYGGLLKDKSSYPVFIDAKKEVLSMPPIINSNYSGKVSKKTKNLFIEVSGFDLKFLEPALNVMVYALADRGGKIETVEIKYDSEVMVTPNLKGKSAILDMNYFNEISGLGLKKNEVLGLLKNSTYVVKSSDKSKMNLVCPCYRQDIMHSVDIVEDLIIRKGYNSIEPEALDIVSFGEMDDKFLYDIEDLMVGVEAQQIMSYLLNNKEDLFVKMGLKESKVIEIENPVSKNWSVFRTSLIPGLMEFLSKNTNREYPQKIFETGKVVIPDSKKETMTKDELNLGYALSDKVADFTKAKQILDFVMSNLGLKYSIKEVHNDSFIKGRVGEVIFDKKKIGVIGEVSPEVLEKWGIEMPVCVFEVNLDSIR